MKRNMRMVLAALSLVSAVASAEQFGDFTYTTNSGNAEITGYTGAGGSIVIPGTIGGMPVIIGDDAFRNVGTLSSVTISNGVTRIGDNAFDRCSLVSVTIPPSVGAIGDRAFAEGVFLTNIAVDVANAAYSSTNGVLFNRDRTWLIQCPGGKDGDYTVPAGVTSIRDSAFRYCKILDSVTIPEGVLEIRSTGFFGCFELTTVSLPDSLQAIRFAAFMACGSLTNVTLSANVTVIEDSAFAGCGSLAAITVDDANTVYCSTNGVLFNKDKTMLIRCPGGKVGSFTLPASVASIGERAFITSHGLLEINVDEANPFFSSTNGVLFNKDGTVLIQCPGGKAGHYVVPSGVLAIGTRALASCDGLTAVTIPASVTNIGERAFEDDSNLTAVYFLGDGPGVVGDVFDGGSDELKVYVLPGTSGWDAPFAGYPPAPWPPEISAVNPGSPTGPFGFNADWAVGMKAVLQFRTNLVSADWLPLYTDTFVNATTHFSDPEWTNHPSGFYRLVHVP